MTGCKEEEIEYVERLVFKNPYIFGLDWGPLPATSLIMHKFLTLTDELIHLHLKHKLTLK